MKQCIPINQSQTKTIREDRTFHQPEKTSSRVLPQSASDISNAKGSAGALTVYHSAMDNSTILLRTSLEEQPVEPNVHPTATPISVSSRQIENKLKAAINQSNESSPPSTIPNNPSPPAPDEAEESKVNHLKAEEKEVDIKEADETKVVESAAAQSLTLEPQTVQSTINHSNSPDTNADASASLTKGSASTIVADKPDSEPDSKPESKESEQSVTSIATSATKSVTEQL